MGNAMRPRLMHDRKFPAYAYLPGSDLPHPVRDPRGHSYEKEVQPVPCVTELPTDALRWGIELFNHGFYREAREAWEPIWLAAKGNAQDRALFKGLIMLAAAGVKIREGKWMAALRHAKRASKSLRQLSLGSDSYPASMIGISPERLASLAEETPARPTTAPRSMSAGQPDPVFPFVLGAGFA